MCLAVYVYVCTLVYNIVIFSHKCLSAGVYKYNEEYTPDFLIHRGDIEQPGGG